MIRSNTFFHEGTKYRATALMDGAIEIYKLVRCRDGGCAPVFVGYVDHMLASAV